MELRLVSASRRGAVKEITSILQYPTLNVNLRDENGWTALQNACQCGKAEVVKLFLALPVIDVNLQGSDGRTVIGCGAWKGQVAVVRLLLQDPRVDIKLADVGGRTPLMWVSCYGYEELAEKIMASGKDLGDLEKTGKWNGKKFFAYWNCH